MNPSCEYRSPILTDDVDEVTEFVDSCVEGIAARPATPQQDLRRPLLTDLVDEVSEFVDRPADAPCQERERVPLLTDVVDELVEFIDTPVDGPGMTTHPSTTSTSPEVRPA